MSRDGITLDSNKSYAGVLASALPSSADKSTIPTSQLMLPTPISIVFTSSESLDYGGLT